MTGLMIFFGLIALFAICEIFDDSPKPAPRKLSPNDWDMIQIGTVAPTVSRRSRPVPVKQEAHPLLDDCVSALVGLGEKSSVAKRDAKRILESNHITSVEDFLRKAYSSK